MQPPSSLSLCFPAESRHVVLSGGVRVGRPLEQVAHTIFFTLFSAGLWRLRAEMTSATHVHVTLAMDAHLWTWIPWRKRRLRNTARWASESFLPTGWKLTLDVVPARKAFGW